MKMTGNLRKVRVIKASLLVTPVIRRRGIPLPIMLSHQLTLKLAEFENKIN